jgi:hypothetical protein
LFTQGFLQFDFDTNGNEVMANTTGAGLQSIGRLTDSSYVYADAGLGYWLTTPATSRHATALIAELHYNGSLNNGDTVRAGALQIGDGGRLDTVNLTAGGSMQVTRNATLSAGYVVPLTDSPDRNFDGALRVNFEYRP